MTPPHGTARPGPPTAAPRPLAVRTARSHTLALAVQLLALGLVLWTIRLLIASVSEVPGSVSLELDAGADHVVKGRHAAETSFPPTLERDDAEYLSTKPLFASEPSRNRDVSALKTSLHIVYFANLRPSRWRRLFYLQLAELADWGLAGYATSISIVLVVDSPEFAFLLPRAKALVAQVLPKASISTFIEPSYEYRGLHKVWQVAQSIPAAEADSHVILYFHSKGMVSVVDWETHLMRSQWNIMLSLVVIKPWKSILVVFDKLPSLQKAGIYTAPFGWVWFNFFYVRASAIRVLPEPSADPPTGRWFYESYISGHVNSTVFRPFPNATRDSYPCSEQDANCLSLCPSWSFASHTPIENSQPHWPLCYNGPGLREYRIPAEFLNGNWEDVEYRKLLDRKQYCGHPVLNLRELAKRRCPHLMGLGKFNLLANPAFNCTDWAVRFCANDFSLLNRPIVVIDHSS